MITPRLAPGVEVGDAWVSIEYSDREGNDGRARYRWFVDFKDGREFSGDDLQSGCDGGNLQGGLESLLGYFSAFGEAQRYPESENREIFPQGLAEWAAENADELGTLSCWLEETVLIEE